MTLARASSLAWVQAGPGLFVLRCDVDDAPVYFDAAAAAVLSACDGAADTDEVIARVAEETGVPAAELADDVTAFVSHLLTAEYVVKHPADGTGAD